ncbi:MAG: SPOR domain-containing protein [Dichotomicrobium sp.]
MRRSKFIAVTACLAGAIALAGPAAAQSKDDLRKLSAAYKLIEEDETAKAVEQLNGILEEKPESSDTAAKAMLLRGQAYAKAGRHAQALADFDAALWLQGLNSSQRKDAVAGRKAALAKLGLEDPGGEETTATAEASGERENDSIPTSTPTSTDEPSSSSEPAGTGETTTASVPEEPDEPETGAWQTNVQTSEAEQAEAEEEDSGSSFFSDLFGGGDSDTEERAEPEQTETAATSGWTASTTEASAPASGDSEGAGYRIQIASVGTREGAESEARRLSRLLGDAIDGETTDIVRADTDAGNTYYRIVVGPKPSRNAAQAMCQDFKSRGVDCLVVSSR